MSNYYMPSLTKYGEERKKKHVDYILDTLLPFVGEKTRVLEIGPGLGYFASACIDKRAAYYGIEPSKKLQVEIRKKMNLNLISCRVPPIPFHDCQIDLVFAGNVLEHMPTYIEAMELLNESYRVLKPGGYLYLEFPNYFAWNKMFFDMDYSHSFITTKRRVAQMLTDSDFIIKNIGIWSIGSWNSGLVSSLLRLVIRFGIIFLNWEIVTLFFEYFNKDELLLKVRKNLLEVIIITAQKKHE